MSKKLTELPDEIIIIIMHMCNAKDLLALGGTCNRLHCLSQTECLWEAKATIAERNSQGEICTYRELYIKFLQKYGQLVGLYQASVGPFGGLSEVRFKDDTIEGVTWDPILSDFNHPLKHNILFSLKPRETLVDGLQCVCLPYLAPHHGILKLGKKKGCFSLLCFNPDVHAKAVWNDFEYDSSTYNKFHLRHGHIKKWRNHLFSDWNLRCHEQKLLCLRYQFDFRMDHKPLILPKPLDIPEELLTPERSCPKQLAAPGLFKGSDHYSGIQLVLLKYKDKETLQAYKVTGDNDVPAGEEYFCAELEYPIIFDEDYDYDSEEEDESLYLQNLELDKKPFEHPVYCVPEQSFQMPDAWRGSPPTDKCYARFHGLGKACHRVTPIHFIVFDENTVGVLWVELECLKVFKRVLQTFNQHHLDRSHSVL